MKKSLLPFLFSTALLSACSLVPDYTRPAVEVPARWKAELAADQSAAIPEQWWTLFQDETLNQLETDAATQNLDIRAGVERVNQARAALRIAGAELLPSASASLGASRTRTDAPLLDADTASSFPASLAIAYDLDLFGANRSATEAARASLHAQEYQQAALKLVTQADLAEAYFNVLTARERVRIGEENLKNAREIEKIIQVRVETGLDSDLELAQQRGIVSTNEAALATLRQQEATYMNALAILLGRAPQTFELQQGKTIADFTVPAVSADQPSVLLERRPDIHAAEQSLLAANANIGAARAAFFPSVSLGGTASVTATSFGDPATSVLSLASTLTAPIFSGGSLEGGLERATAEQRELVETYRKTVLVAFREVEDALAATRGAADRETALRVAMENARKAYDISRKRYDVGTIDFQTLLDTQTSLLAAEDSYAQALDARLAASLDLIKALGGGWTDPQAPKPEVPAAEAPVAPEAAPSAAPVSTLPAPVTPEENADRAG